MSIQASKTPKPRVRVVAVAAHGQLHLRVEWQINPRTWVEVWTGETPCARARDRITALSSALRAIGLLMPPQDWPADQPEITTKVEIEDWAVLLPALTTHRHHRLAQASEVETGWRRAMADGYHHSWLKSPQIAALTDTPARTVTSVIRTPRLRSLTLDIASIRRKGNR